LIVPLALLAPTSVVRRFRDPSEGDKAAQNARLTVWTAGWRMIRTHPLIGVGLHNFKPLLPVYQVGDEKVISLAHNTYLELAAETGIPGLVAFVGVLGVSFRSLRQVRRHAIAARLPLLSSAALGLQAGLLSYFISAFFMSGWWEKMLWLLIFITVCMRRLTRDVIIATRRQQREIPLRLEAAAAGGRA